MDGLTQALVNRQTPQAPDQNSSVSYPAVQTSGHTPSAQRRFDTSQAMQNAYRNQWSPNPILLRVLMGREAQK